MLKHVLKEISPINKDLLKKAELHLDNLTKPRGSLGRLEELAARLYAISCAKKPEVEPGIIFTCAGDHGVAQAGVSLFPRAVTRQMVTNFLNGGAAVNVLARTSGLQLKVVDVGVAGPSFPGHDLLIQNRIRSGTGDLSAGPAMSELECQKAIELGIDLAKQAYEKGIKTLCTGEMGIGNTTPSTALYCAFLGFEPHDLAGSGTGLESDGIKKKARVIAKGLEVNAEILNSKDPIKILAALGGLEIACLTGIILGGAWKGMNVIIDGFISSAAYVSAWKLNPFVEDYCFFSHLSAEKGHIMVMEKIQARPVLNMDMRLGEGTGAALAYFILKSAANIFNEMATFDQAGVSR
ncbi:nicotinate-nucleotide--dimethylbenzimidazole phosphoribosyltransferase [Desulfonatronovibrio hydrogenovorans]|uniref:nicotinate-nucleotide--dimethylbenzimidazole phosphoribosyltransferase n=1 Tax=Desulfonatronovibrio hydrogenovorans TaxID=53245 RepID=UPI00048AB8C6|nr:nicotinate-nucleotide--dimethylbenzimidazole phosphoribosyltransferase [Desulfonatronovibrio hydrogenovorans]